MDLSKLGQTTLNISPRLTKGYGSSFGDQSLSSEERAQRAERALDVASIAIYQLEKENKQLKQNACCPSYCGKNLNVNA